MVISQVRLCGAKEPGEGGKPWILEAKDAGLRTDASSAQCLNLVLHVVLW